MSQLSKVLFFFLLFLHSADLEDYAQTIGIDIDTDKDLLWIAREGLKAPLPAGWKPWLVYLPFNHDHGLQPGWLVWRDLLLQLRERRKLMGTSM
jgi:hypothetical protein